MIQLIIKELDSDYEDIEDEEYIFPSKKVHALSLLNNKIKDVITN